MNTHSDPTTPRGSNPPLFSRRPLIWPETASTPFSGVRHHRVGVRQRAATPGGRTAGFIDDALDQIGRSGPVQTALGLVDLARQAASALVTTAMTLVLDLLLREVPQ